MKLGSLFGTPKTLADNVVKQKPATTTPATAGAPLAGIFKDIPTGPKHNPDKPFPIEWPVVKPQGVKDYQVITTKADLIKYLQRCEETGYGGFDYETAPDELHRAEPKAPFDPWKSDICAASIAAAPNEARAVFISHKRGRKLFEPSLSRDEARKVFMDTLDEYLFRNRKVIKISCNIGFETKHSLKHAKYILMPVADPITAWVRCIQVAAPERIKDPKKPTSGKGLKPMTKEVFGVEMTDYTALLDRHEVDFFDELDADSTDALVYCCEDSDYAVQHYLYWLEVMRQITGYEKWLHEIEMPFGRVIGTMEYWGMAWDDNLAQIKAEEAQIMREQAAEEIKRIIKDAVGQDVNPGKTGKTQQVKDVIFKVMQLPVTKISEKTTDPSLDEEALIDMTFALENNLQNIDEEKYLAVPLPVDWAEIDPDLPPVPAEGWPADLEERTKAQAKYAVKYRRSMQLSKEERGAIRVAQRQPHPYKDAGIALLEQLKKIQKYTTLLSSHIEGRRKYINSVTKRIHAEYSPWTETARCNCKNPNGQNVPRPDNDELKIRNFYIPGPGKVLLLIDFAGFELRLMAWKAEDEVMIDIFTNGGDIHAKTASEATGKPIDRVEKKERQDAKPVNFGVSYGATEHAVQKTFKTDYGMRKTLDYCASLIAAVKRAYPGIPRYQRSIELDAREKGWVSTIYGYIRLLPGINGVKDWVRRAAARRAANTPIQGSAADIMKRVQNAVYEKTGEDTYGMALIEKYGLNDEATAWVDEDTYPILVHGHADNCGQIHDEIIIEIDDDPAAVERAYNWIKAEMEKPPLPDFPLPIGADGSVAAGGWGDKIKAEKWIEERKGAA